MSLIAVLLRIYGKPAELVFTKWHFLETTKSGQLFEALHVEIRKKPLLFDVFQNCQKCAKIDTFWMSKSVNFHISLLYTVIRTYSPAKNYLIGKPRLSRTQACFTGLTGLLY